MALKSDATILIVDDCPTTLESMRVVIASQGNYTILTATDGQNAWQTLKKMAVDLIISDKEMPGIDGPMLLAMVQADEYFRPIPFWLVTMDKITKSEADEMRDASANAFFNKENLLERFKKLAPAL